MSKDETDLPTIAYMCGAADARDDCRKVIEAQAARIEALEGALRAYTEYCDICHGRGSIIEEDEATGADLWRDCPGCTPAREALQEE